MSFQSNATPPLDFATSYRSMWAFGNHLRFANAKHHLLTTNFGVAITFEQECCSCSNDRDPVLASLEYVGWIEEILELDYGRFQTIVLLCNRVVANYFGFVAIVKQNEYGFTLVNIEWLIPFFVELFAFPMHVSQVFLAEDARSTRSWKVILGQKLRGQRSKYTRETNPKISMFDLGSNVDHARLRVTISLEQVAAPLKMWMKWMEN